MFATVAGIANENKDRLPFSDTELEVLETADKGRPIFRKKGDKVYLNMLNLQGDKIQIKVIDSDKRLLFKEVVEAETVEKAFNFENAHSDSYIVMVTDSEGTYSERILVK